MALHDKLRPKLTSILTFHKHFFTLLPVVHIHIHIHIYVLAFQLNPTSYMSTHPVEFSRFQHPVCCPLLDSAGWMLFLLCIYTRALWFDCRIRTQPAKSNRVQHTGNLLNPTGCVPMQPVQISLAHLYYVDVLIKVLRYNQNPPTTWTLVSDSLVYLPPRTWVPMA